MRQRFTSLKDSTKHLSSQIQHPMYHKPSEFNQKAPNPKQTPYVFESPTLVSFKEEKKEDWGIKAFLINIF